jgi:hypothetical protein
MMIYIPSGEEGERGEGGGGVSYSEELVVNSE